MIPNINKFAEYIITRDNEIAWLFGMLLAFETKLPLVVDRGKEKNYGARKRYEGIEDIKKLLGKRVVEIKIIENFKGE